MNVNKLQEMGLDGAGATVAVVDTGIDPEGIPGSAPVDNHNFTLDATSRDRKRSHGTKVATCIRMVAPKADIVNVKVVSSHDRTTPKGVVAEAIANIAVSGIDILNISLDFERAGCSPRQEWVTTSVKEALGSDTGPPNQLAAIEIRRSATLIPESACQLCQTCDAAVNGGVAVVAAAGNGWGAPMGCPAQCPTVLAVTSSWTRAEGRHAYDGLSRLRRWWEWRVLGRIGLQWGTSWSAGYASGIVALMMPYIRQVGWVRAFDEFVRLPPPPRRITLDALDVLHRLQAIVDDPMDPLRGATSAAEARNAGLVIDALAIARSEPRLIGHMRALEILTSFDPAELPPARRVHVIAYLAWLQEIGRHDPESRTGLDHAGLADLLYTWSDDHTAAPIVD